MKRLQWMPLSIMLFLLIGILGAAAAHGQAAPVGTSQVLTPSQLSVAGTIGDSITRKVLVRLPSNAQGVHVVVGEMADDTGFKTLPLDAVTTTAALLNIPGAEVALNPDRDPAGEPGDPATSLAGAAAGAPAERQALTGTTPITVLAPMQVTIDLSKAAAGSYTGQALLLYTVPLEGGQGVQQVEAPLGLTIAVKDQPWLPLGILVAGVILGFGLTFYGAYRLPRDQVLARLGEVQHRLAADAELSTSTESPGRGHDWGLAAEEYANGALTALREGDNETAKKNASKAERIVDVWQRQRRNWLEQLKARDEIADRLDTLRSDTGSVYVTAVERGLAEAPRVQIDKIVATDTPSDTTWRESVENLRSELDKLRGFLVDYAALKTAKNEAATYVALSGLPQAQINQKTQELEEIYADLNRMNPLTAEDYPAATAALRDRITAVRTSVPAHSPESSPVQPQHMGQAAAASVPFSLGDTMNWLGGTQLPSLQELGKTRGPLLSVKAFVFVSTLLLLGLLVLAGFNELYIQQQAFGSAWLTDYLTLAAWGFGAEATRAALANLALGWGIARSAGSS